jgi:hypothetical protein
MAVQTSGVGSRHILGDLVYRTYNSLAGVNAGDTLVVPQSRIEVVSIMPTTSVAVGVTWQNGVPDSAHSTLTFQGGSAWAGQIGVFSREG